MKVLIFGATGGIGKWAVKHAFKKGHEVTAFVRNPQKINIQNPCLSSAAKRNTYNILIF